VDRLRTWGRNPWLVVGIAFGALLVCAWIGWTISVWSKHGAREGLGALISIAAIAVIVAAIIMSLVAVYLLVRPREGADDSAPATEDEEKEEPAEPEAGAAAN
jgi:TRAP-type C4-dicarboxylate transport system permease small subunit